jgi:type II secretory pathway pseudopilin PulG
MTRACRAFSLVELLIAISILIIVAAMVAGVYTPMIAQSQEEVLKANLRAIRKAIHAFYNDQRRYPYEGQDQFGNIVAFLDSNTSEIVQGPHSGRGSYPARRMRYLMSIPIDPTLSDEERRSAGWKLVYANWPCGGAGRSICEVKDVQSLNPQYAAW